MSISEVEVTHWVNYVFDHPVTDPEWYWGADALDIDMVLDPVREACLFAETFERSQELLLRFSSAQINQGLNYLISNACSSHMFALLDVSVPESTRLRALRSFIPLFETTMFQRCSHHLSHLDEPGADALNAACYMWWDSLPFAPSPEDASRRSFDSEALLVMSRILDVRHDACRESALHGLGHWQYRYPSEVVGIIDRFLLSASGLRDELRHYAYAARRGMVN